MDPTLLPERMFAAGEEPAGDRVNTYHKPKRIESILEALDPEEVEFLRQSTFGKIIAQAENPSFSGSFGQFVLVRNLRVKKKYEIWFLFAGKPIRMSLHEFAHVTGLNCRKIPKKSIKRKKNPITEKLYWGELFGSLKFCLVDTAIEMLKKRKIKDRAMRLKYACLAFTSCVLLPTSHLPRIIPEHVELIRDLNQFLNYPWGRLAFEMLVTGIKKKDEILLSQTSVALPGFVDAIQLVFIAAVPQIRETVNTPEPVVVIDSDTDSETGEDEAEDETPVLIEATPVTQATARYCVNPAHVRDMDEEGKVDVISMVVDTAHTEEELMWDDEVNDELVDNLVRLIQQGHRFDKSMFVGGLTAAALTRMRAERKLKEAKDKKERDSHSNVNSPDGDIGDAYHPTLIANLVGRMVTQQIDDAVYKLVGKLEDRLAVVIKAELLNMQAVVSQSIIGHLGNFKPIGAENEDNTGCVPQVDQNPTDCTSPQPAPEPATTGGKPTVLQTAIPEHQSVLVFDQPRADTVINKVISDVKCFTEQSEVFATDVMTHTPITEQLDAEDVNNMVDDVPDTPMDTDFTTPLCGQKTSFIHHQLSPVSEEEKNYHNEEDVSRTELLPGAVHIPVGNVDIGETRKSRRTRILPPLFNDYQCDPKIKAFRVEQPPITSADNINEIYMSMRESAGLNKVYNVGNGIAVTTEELNDVVDRTLQMPPKVMDALMYYIALERDRKRIHSSRIAIHDTNFPALLMKQHARLVKCAVRDRCRLKYDADVLKYFRGATVQILDCNYGFRTDGMLKKDMNPITIVVPHILNAAAGNLGPNQRKQYEMIRLPGVPQNPISTDAATTTALLIQAHALNKADGCKEITQDSLSAGAKHLAVLVYRDVAPL
ncbi:Uncharacterized protein Rs2_00354 [Raphanus sativus]|nr:Uncharacterized protein Rs2_00354 [Raphanus sativus]